jgi:predicted Zn-dependent peptidase
MTPESLTAWYDTHVKNHKPVVAVIGDTKGTSLASVFVKNFSGSRIQERKIPEEFAKVMEKGESAEQSWDRSESLILVGFQAPPEEDEDAYATSVLRSYLGDPGKLSQELRDRLGVAHEVRASYKPRLRGGSLIILAVTTPENEEDALKALRGEIKKIIAGPIPYREFRSAVNEASGTYAIAQQVRFAQIGELAEEVLSGKGIDVFLGHAAGLQEVKEEDLNAIAQRILNMDRAAVVRVHGKK